MGISNIYLAKCGNFVAQKVKNVDYMTCLCRILTQGEYVDMNGTKVIVDEDVLTKLVANYNSDVEEEFIKFQQLITENSNDLDAMLVQDKLNMSIEEFDYLPNQIDHNTATIKATVGNIIGRMQLKYSQGKLAIFANIKVKGSENVACVADNRWRNLSVQYNPVTYQWVEVSWVIYGADPDANKIMSHALSRTSIPGPDIDTKITTLIKQCDDTIYALERKIFIDVQLIKLCKLRKITKADAYFIEKELHEIQELTTLGKVFNILDMQLRIPKKEKFLESDKQIMNDLHNTLKAISNDKIYN